MPLETFNDEFSESDIYTVLLYMYEWKISNISTMKSFSKPVTSPAFSIPICKNCKNFQIKFFLTSTGEDNFKVEVHFIKRRLSLLDETWFTRQHDCLFDSNFKKRTVGLEFLDHNGKMIQSYKSLPVQLIIATSSVFTMSWSVEENLSSFSYKDSFTVRAKLSMRFCSNPAKIPTFCHDESTKNLLMNMENLFKDRNRFPDLRIKIEHAYVPCHGSVIHFQYPYFLKLAEKKADAVSEVDWDTCFKFTNSFSHKTNNNCKTLTLLNTNVNVFLAVLYFIYTKQLQIFTNVDDFDVYEFAKKYAIEDLSMLLKPSEMKVCSKISIKKPIYTWRVENFTSLKNISSPIQSPLFETEIGSEIVIWNATLTFIDSNNVLFELKRLNGERNNTESIFKGIVQDTKGSVHNEQEVKYTFKSGAFENCLEVNEAFSPFYITTKLLDGDNLEISCELSFYTGKISSDIKSYYLSQRPVLDLSYWVNNFQKLFESECFSDVTFIVEDKEFRVHKAFLASKSPVFASMFQIDMKEKRSGCVLIEDVSSTVMEKALNYIYTCKVDDLTVTQASELLYVAEKYELMDLKSKCSEFLLRNIDVDCASDILIIADLFMDKQLKTAAKKLICHKI